MYYKIPANDLYELILDRLYLEAISQNGGLEWEGLTPAILKFLEEKQCLEMSILAENELIEAEYELIEE